jgi:hypothetical protein
VQSLDPGRLRDGGQPGGRERGAELQRERAARCESGGRRRVEIEDERRRAVRPVEAGEERVELEGARARRPRQRRGFLEPAVAQRLAARAHDLGHRDPGGPPGGAVRLEPPRRVDPVREARQRDGAPGEVRQERRRDRDQVAGEVELREPRRRVQHLLRTREADAAVTDDELDGR